MKYYFDDKPSVGQDIQQTSYIGADSTNDRQTDEHACCLKCIFVCP
jgi:hypothetical protein